MNASSAKAPSEQPRAYRPRLKTLRALWAAEELGRARLVGEGHAWLSQTRWHLWCGLTFSTLPNEREAHLALRRWLRVVARALNMHVAYVFGGDLFANAGSHFHVLLGLERPPSASERRYVERLWIKWHGIAVVRAYRPGYGGEAYLLEHQQWDRNVACPRPPACRRAKGCTRAPGSWK